MLALVAVASAAPPAGFPEAVMVTPPTASGLSPYRLTWMDAGSDAANNDPLLTGDAGYGGGLGGGFQSCMDFAGGGVNAIVTFYNMSNNVAWSQAAFPGDFSSFEALNASIAAGEVTDGPGWGTAGFLLPLPAEAQSAPEPSSLLILASILPVGLLRRCRSSGSSSRRRWAASLPSC